MTLLQLLIDSQKNWLSSLRLLMSITNRPESDQEEKALVRYLEQLGVKIFIKFSSNFQKMLLSSFVMIFEKVMQAEHYAL